MPASSPCECLFLENGLAGLGSSRIPLRQALLAAAQGLHQKMSTLSPCPVIAALCRPRIAESVALVMASSLGECTMGFQSSSHAGKGRLCSLQEEHQKRVPATLTVRTSLWGVLKKEHSDAETPGFYWPPQEDQDIRRVIDVTHSCS